MEALFLPNKKRQTRNIPLKHQVPFNELLCQYHSSAFPRKKIVAISPLSTFYRNSSSYSIRNLIYNNNTSSPRNNAANDEEELSDVTENDVDKSEDDESVNAPPDSFKKSHKETDLQIMQIKKYSEEQCLYYRKCIEDGIETYIPKELITEYVKQDIFESHDVPKITRLGCPVQTVKDTILSLSHLRNSFFLCVCGAMMDELRLHPAASISKPFFDRRGFKPISMSGFTIPVGRQSHLRQLCSAGFCDYFSASQVLARTQKDVTLLRTRTSEYMSSTILEPLQRWQLPNDILDMSSSNIGAFATASILTDAGMLYLWTPMNGLHRSSDRVIIPGAYRQSTATQSMLIRCSQHNPVVNYATYGRHLFSLDIRCDRVGAYLYSTGNSAITAVSDSVDPHSLLVAVGQDIALMDSRFLKTFVSKRRVGQLTTMMKSIYGHSLLADTLLTASSDATQILVHTIEHARDAATSPLGILQCGALPHGCSDSGLAGWTVDALPVADCGGADGMWSPVDAASLCGFDIISVYDSQSGNGGDDKKGRDYMLVQQNTMGDVFCQRLSHQDCGFGAEGSADCSSHIQPVHSRLPIGHRYTDFCTSELLKKRPTCEHRSVKEEWGWTVRFPVCNMDYYVEKKQQNQFTVECAHPVGSSSFYKFVPDETLKRFDLLLLLPNRVKTASSEKREDLDVSSVNSLEQVLDAFVMELAKSGQRLTLWEAWKHLTKKTALEIDLKILRQTLLECPELVEDIIAVTLGALRISDGFEVVKPPSSLSSHDAMEGDSLSSCCACAADSVHSDVAAEGLCQSSACLRAHLFVYRSHRSTVDATNFIPSGDTGHAQDTVLYTRRDRIDFFSNSNCFEDETHHVPGSSSSSSANRRRRAEISDSLLSSLSERWVQLKDIVLMSQIK